MIKSTTIPNLQRVEPVESSFERFDPGDVVAVVVVVVVVAVAWVVGVDRIAVWVQSFPKSRYDDAMWREREDSLQNPTRIHPWRVPMEDGDANQKDWEESPSWLWKDHQRYPNDRLPIRPRRWTRHERVEPGKAGKEPPREWRGGDD